MAHFSFFLALTVCGVGVAEGAGVRAARAGMGI